MTVYNAVQSDDFTGGELTTQTPHERYLTYILRVLCMEQRWLKHGKGGGGGATAEGSA